MSIFSKIFGGTFEGYLSEGDALFSQGLFGEAKLAYENADRKSKDQAPGEAEAVREKIRACCAELVNQYIIQADQEIADGDKERACELLDEARLICDDPVIVEEITNRRKHYEAQEARRLASDAEEIDDDELLSIIAGTWTEHQALEYAAMPEEFHQALLAGHDGQNERAAELLVEIAKRPDLQEKPRYIWFEAARELAAAEKWEEALDALDKFQEATVGDPDALEVQITATALSAQALVELERFDEAKETLIETTLIDPGNHVHYLNLGMFLRLREDYEQSLEALDRAVELMGQMQPDFQVIRELGFTYLALGRQKEAQASLEAVVEHIASTGRHDQIDPQAGVALAGLYEEKGDFKRASDLYRHLAVGYDLANHFTYNLQAARLLGRAREDRELVERYLSRADELAETAEQEKMVQQLRSAVGE